MISVHNILNFTVHLVTEKEDLEKVGDIASNWLSLSDYILCNTDRSSATYEPLVGCKMIISLMIEGSLEKTSNELKELYICEDLQGTPQGLLEISIYRDLIEITKIVTNPTNLTSEEFREKEESFPSPVRGSGTALMMQVIQRGIELKKSQISIVPVLSGVNFYRKFGFETVIEKNTLNMVLTSDKIWHMYPHLILPQIAA